MSKILIGSIHQAFVSGSVVLGDKMTLPLKGTGLAGGVYELTRREQDASVPHYDAKLVSADCAGATPIYASLRI